MDVKVKKNGTWAITPAGPIEDIKVGQIIGGKYTALFREKLVNSGYADFVYPKKETVPIIGYMQISEPSELKKYALDTLGVKLKGNKSADTLKSEIEEIINDRS